MPTSKCDFCGVPLDEPTADAACPHGMTSGKLRDMACDEREYAAELITDENYFRAHGFDGGQLPACEASQALSRAAELERAASLDEVA